MKKLILLFVILVALLSLAYFTEEYLPRVKEAQKQAQNEARYDIRHLNRMEFNQFSLVKDKNDVWEIVETKDKADQLLIDQFLNSLSQLEFLRKIELNETNRARFIQDNHFFVKFHYAGKFAKYTLGNKHPIEEAFYLLVQKDDESFIALVKDHEAIPKAYQQGNRLQYQYAKYKTMLSLKKTDIIDRKVLRNDLRVIVNYLH